MKNALKFARFLFFVAFGLLVGAGKAQTITVDGTALDPTKPHAITYVPATPAVGLPTLSNFVASPALITPGGHSTLTWTASAGSALTITNCACIPASGMTVLPTATTTYLLTATNSAGSVSASVTVSVEPTPQTWPVTIPGAATPTPNIEQMSGWISNASSSISPNPPSTYTITQTGPVMTLATKGTSGKYTGWMASKSIGTNGHLNMLVRATYTFSSVSGIQAWEVGRRATNAAGVTDNGQTQLVPISGRTQLEFDKVPSPSGGWLDTGCRFPMFVAGTTYTEELYYVNSASGALSLMYVSLNGGTPCAIPASLQNIAGSSMGWTKSSAVMAFQPDANPTAVAYNAIVTMNAWTW